MRIPLTSVLILSAGFATATLADDKAMDHGKMMDHSKMDHGAMKHGEAMPGKTEASGVAVINSVDADKGMINLTHEPMPDLGWPTMTMDLPVTKRVDLGSVKAGDKVDFKVKLGRDKQYRVTDMEAAK
ncbi:MAG: copper-binding protein [Alphaproteobacteria bacterium]|nr:copper-binding protein [Alphaproteobacteria bacterium]